VTVGSAGDDRDVADLAGQRRVRLHDVLHRRSGVDAGGRPVTIDAGLHDAFVHGVEGHAADAVREGVAVQVLLDLVAGHARELRRAIGTHVHVVLAGRCLHVVGDVAVLDVVVATGPGMAEDAGCARRDACILCNALRDLVQVDARVRGTRRRRTFLVRAGLVMAGQAVDVLRVAKVEVLVLPADADVALRAPTLVGRHRLAEIVDEVLLAVDPGLVAGDVGRDTVPLPVGGRHHVVTDLAVAVQALARARVGIVGEITLVQRDRIIGTRGGTAVIDVDLAVLVDVLGREVGDAVGVQVPAVEAIRSGRAGRSGRTRLAGRSGRPVGTVVAAASAQGQHRGREY
jgi:hypothetical protein